MFNTHSNYGVNAELINANANANVNVVNVTNQGSNSTIPADPIEAEIQSLQIELAQFDQQATHTSFSMKYIEEMNLKRKRLKYLLGETSVDPYSTLQNTPSPNLQVVFDEQEKKEEFLRLVGIAGLVGYTLYGMSQAVKKKSPVWAVASVAPAFVFYKILEGWGGDMFGTRFSRGSGQRINSSGPIIGGLKTSGYAG